MTKRFDTAAQVALLDSALAELHCASKHLILAAAEGMNKQHAHASCTDEWRLLDEGMRIRRAAFRIMHEYGKEVE